MTQKANEERLRPLERRVLAMRRQGVPVEEIASRIRRTPRFVERIFNWIEIPRTDPPSRDVPTPLERVVMRLRASGDSDSDIAHKIKRSERFVRQVEGHAHFRKGVDLLSDSSLQAREEARDR